MHVLHGALLQGARARAGAFAAAGERGGNDGAGMGRCDKASRAIARARRRGEHSAVTKHARTAQLQSAIAEHGPGVRVGRGCAGRKGQVSLSPTNEDGLLRKAPQHPTDADGCRGGVGGL